MTSTFRIQLKHIAKITTHKLAHTLAASMAQRLTMLALGLSLSLVGCKSSDSANPVPNQSIKNTTLLTANFVQSSNGATLLTTVRRPQSRSFDLAYGFAQRDILDWAVGDSTNGRLIFDASVGGFALTYNDLVLRTGKYIVAYLGETTAGSAKPPQRLVVPNFSNPVGDTAQIKFLHTYTGYDRLWVLINRDTLGSINYGTFATFSGRIKPSGADTVRLVNAADNITINSTTVSDVLVRNKVILAAIRPSSATPSRTLIQIIAQD